MAEPLTKAPIHSMALSPTDVMRDMVCEDPDSTSKDPCGDAGSQPRKALGDVTNAWSFVPRTKAGDLGVETFKKFLEKKRRDNDGVEAEPPARIPLERDVEDRRDAFGEVMDDKPAEPSQEDESPWSYEVQVPLWPLNMTLALSVQEEPNDEKDPTPSPAPEESNNDLRGDLPYFQEMQSRKESVAENAHAGIAQPLSVPQSDFVCADGAGGSVGQKLPQPQQQGAHTIATNTGGYILAQAKHPFEESVASVMSTGTPVALFAMDADPESLVPLSQEATGEMPEATDALGGLEDESVPKIEQQIVPPNAGERASVGAGVDVESAIEIQAPSIQPAASSEANPPSDALASPHVQAETEDSAFSATMVNPLVRQFCVTPAKADEVGARTGAGIGEERGEEMTAPLAVPAPVSQPAAPAPALAAPVEVGAPDLAAMASRIQRRVRHTAFRRTMGIMIKLRGTQGLVKSMKSETFARDVDERILAMQNRVTCIPSAQSGGASLGLGMAVADAAQGCADIECAVQAQLDSEAKALKYQQRYERRRTQERAACLIQARWRTSHTLRSFRRHIACTAIQQAWRAHVTWKKRDADQASNRALGARIQDISAAVPAAAPAPPLPGAAVGVGAGSANAELSAHEARIATAKAQIDTTKARIETTQARIENAALRDELAKMKSEVEALKTMVTVDKKKRRGRSHSRGRRGRDHENGTRSLSAVRDNGRARGCEEGAAAAHGKPKRSRSLSRNRRKRGNGPKGSGAQDAGAMANAGAQSAVGTSLASDPLATRPPGLGGPLRSSTNADWLQNSKGMSGWYRKKVNRYR